MLHHLYYSVYFTLMKTNTQTTLVSSQGGRLWVVAVTHKGLDHKLLCKDFARKLHLVLDFLFWGKVKKNYITVLPLEKFPSLILFYNTLLSNFSIFILFNRIPHIYNIQVYLDN